MSTSEKQLLANRQNAQKSTGPKSEHGKTVAGRNSIKHGLFAGDIIIDSPHLKEDKTEYDFLLSSLIAELHPETFFQEFLVRRIANCLWRYRRVIGAETALLSRQLKDIDRDFADEISLPSPAPTDPDNPCQPQESENPTLKDVIGLRSILPESQSVNILRYEMRLDRQLTRALRLLKYLQFDKTADLLQD